MSDQFKASWEGLCIGGPYAGRSMAHGGPRISFPDHGRAATFVAGREPRSSPSAFEAHTYRYEEFRVPGTDKIIRLWVYEPLTLYDAMIKVFSTYERSPS